MSSQPSAELREFAALMWQTFLALQNEGFTEQQALTIVGRILATKAGQK